MELKDILNDIQTAEVNRVKLEAEKETKIDPRILKMKKGGTYTLKLLPNPKDTANSIVTFKEVGFTSFADKKSYVYLGRQYADAGIKKDPVNAAQWDAYSKAKERGDQVGMDQSYKLFPQSKKVINALLVAVSGDDTYKDKVGEVFMFRFPAQENSKTKEPSSAIYKEIHESLYGAKAAKMGKKVLLLSDKPSDFYNGKNLVVKVVDKGGFMNYDATRFEDADESETPVTQDILRKAFESVHDLTEIIPSIKTVEEIKKALDEHFYCLSASPEDDIQDEEEQDELLKAATGGDEEDDDEIPGLGDDVTADELLKGL